MHIRELTPLLRMVEPLRAAPAAWDVLCTIEELVQKATTPSMAQSVCEHIISMCNPRAWGDLAIQSLGPSMPSWQGYLQELSDVAAQCGQAIYENAKAQRSRDALYLPKEGP
jgi:hypothetical protein